jgi:hypothetical protein
MSAKRANEMLLGPYAVTAWTSLQDAREYIVSVLAGDVSPRNGLTVQFRKATNANGDNPANHGSAITADDRILESILAADLGATNNGVPYTHVSAIVTDEDSPNTYTAHAFLGSLKETPSN